MDPTSGRVQPGRSLQRKSAVLLGGTTWSVWCCIAHEIPQTDTVITHPDVVFYDFYAAWTAPNATDEAMYLGK